MQFPSGWVKNERKMQFELNLNAISFRLSQKWKKNVIWTQFKIPLKYEYYYLLKWRFFPSRPEIKTLFYGLYYHMESEGHRTDVSQLPVTPY